MEAVGLAASAVTLAALFSSCIDCFSYFKAAQECLVEGESLLVLLDCEKAKLLSWANHVGLLQIDRRQRHPQLADSTINDLVRRCIEQIVALLTDAQKLQHEYGSQQTTQTDTRPSLMMVSANEKNPGWLSRFKWAIRDSAKFKALILRLRDFVDTLIQLVPVPPNIIVDSISEDIATIIDIGALRLTESACEESYPTWAARASETIRDSELGTVDRRNFEEYFGDTHSDETQIIAQVDSSKLGQSPAVNLDPNVLFLITTEKCLDLDPVSYCSSGGIGEIFGSDNYKVLDRISFTCKNTVKWNTRRRIMAHVKPPFDSQEEEDKSDERCFEISQTTGYEVRYPVRSMIYIYCGPCACAIATALRLAVVNGASKYFGFTIRIDHRIGTSCRRTDSMEDVLTKIHEAIDGYTVSTTDTSQSIGCIDVPRLEQQLYELAEETPRELTPESVLRELIADLYSRRSELQRLAGAIFILEEEVCRISMENYPIKPAARQPRETEIYGFSYIPASDSMRLARRFLGKYTRSESSLQKRKDNALAEERAKEESMKLFVSSVKGNGRYMESLSPDTPESSSKRPRLSSPERD